MPLRDHFLRVLFLVFNLGKEAFDEVCLLDLLRLHLIQYMRLARLGLLSCLVHCYVREYRQSLPLAEELL